MAIIAVSLSVCLSGISVSGFIPSLDCMTGGRQPQSTCQRSKWNSSACRLKCKAIQIRSEPETESQSKPKPEPDPDSRVNVKS